VAPHSRTDVVVALDVDGVLVEAGTDHWLDVVAAEFGLTPDYFDPFFQTHWAHVVTGQRAVEHALSSFDPDLDVERFLLRWFEQSSTINYEIIDAARQWRARGARLVLATNQEHRRAAFLAEQLAAHVEIDDVFYSAALGVGKPSAKFFGLADARLGGAPVVFVDDALGNVEAARAHGWHAVHYPHDADWREQVDGYFK
jgi:putative hydrolase of the HAD superfamily